MRLPLQKISAISTLLVLFTIMSPQLYAMDGATLAQQVYNRDDGKDSYATIRMLLLDKRDKKRFRTLIAASKEFGDTIRSYMRFTSPADIDGTSFLTWENEDRENDQFLYLPALNRVRRIVSTQKSSRFVNTDYTYEDMERRKPNLDSHTILREERKNGYDCWVLESIPNDPKSSQYSKYVSWIAKTQLLPIRTEYYDNRGKLKKEFSATKVEQVDGIWAVTESKMYDLKKKHHTYMKTLEIAFNRNIPDRVFTKAYLMHGE